MNPSTQTQFLRNDPKIWLAVASVLSAGLLTADAQSYAYDGFEYAPGDLTANSHNWPTPFFASGWDANAAWGGVPGTILQVQGGSASYAGVPTSGGSLAVGTQTFSDGWAGNNTVANRAARPFATPWDSNTVGTYYISFLMGFGGDSIGHPGYRAFEMWSQQVNDDPGRVLQLGYSEYGDFGDGVGLDNMWLRVTPNGANTPGEPLAVDSINAVSGSASFAADGGATHLFILRFDLSNVAGLDVIQLYLDPTDLNDEFGNTPSTLFVGDFAATHLSAGSQFIIPAIPDGAVGGPADVSPLPANIGIFDELHVSGDWSGLFAIPEPTTFSLALGGLGTLALTLLRRKRD